MGRVFHLIEGKSALTWSWRRGSFSFPSISVFPFFADDVKYMERLSHDIVSSYAVPRKMADNLGFSAPSATVQPDTSENAPLLQEQEEGNVDPGPPPPFIASK